MTDHDPGPLWEQALEGPSTAEAPVWAVTRSRVEELAGRRVTDEEAARIAKAIDFSTANEAVEDAVLQVCGYPPEEDDDGKDEPALPPDSCFICGDIDQPEYRHLPGEHASEIRRLTAQYRTSPGSVTQEERDFLRDAGVINADGVVN